VKDEEALFRRLKRDVNADYNSKGQVNWRREACEDFDFDAGEQLNEEDKAILQDAKRPIVIQPLTNGGSVMLASLTFFKNRNLVERLGDVWTPTNPLPTRGGYGVGAARVSFIPITNGSRRTCLASRDTRLPRRSFYGMPSSSATPTGLANRPGARRAVCRSQRLPHPS
jgi:hypothetical protein